jgi:parallel beta helix pectate lyase-like protein
LKKIIISFSIILSFFTGTLYSANIDLVPLMQSNETVVLNPLNTYYTSVEYSIQHNITIQGNGAVITINGGPIRSSTSGRQLNIENCTITGNSVWAAVGYYNGATGEISNVAISCPGGTSVYVNKSTSVLNNVHISNSTYGVQGRGNCNITQTNGNYSGCTYSYQQEEGTSNWLAGSVTQAGGAALTFNNTTQVTMNGTRVSMTDKNSIAIQFKDSSSGNLTGIIISGPSHGILADSGNINLSSGAFTSPFLFNDGAGAGVASQKGASLTVKNSNFTGFANVIQVSANTPQGTANVENCRFTDSEVSALSTVEAVNLRFYNNLCLDPKQDAIYLKKSTGKIERNRIFRSLNTGIAVLNCPSGLVISDNLIKGCIHQGIALTEKSNNIIINNNTSIENIIANILINDSSSGTAFNNIFANAPDIDIRFQGMDECKSISNIIFGAPTGVECQNSNNSHFRMNRICNHSLEGILNFSGSPTQAICSDFQNNATGDSSRYSILNTSLGIFTGQGNSIGPAASNGYFNDAGNVSYFTKNYWGAENGPDGKGSGDGSVLNWNSGNGSTVTYQPFSTEANVFSDHTGSLEVSPNGKHTWTGSFPWISIEFKYKSSAPSIGNEICGGLFCNKTSFLGPESFPDNFLPDHIYVVWTSHLAMHYSRSIKINFQYDPAGVTKTLKAYRRKPDGGYDPVESVHTPGNNTVIITPVDPFDAQGTYVLVEEEINTNGIMLH